ncbi:hypothetical protein [Sporosarcina newyorkensis]|nr:hypothetical protein SAMN04244570_2989 [Sporosarcina newyorkensis]
MEPSLRAAIGYCLHDIDYVPVSPVIEIEYILHYTVGVLEKVFVATQEQTGVAPRTSKFRESRPQV